MSIKGATFDIGGVLYSDNVFKEAARKALRQLGANFEDMRFDAIYQNHLESQTGSLRNKLCTEFLGSLEKREELLKTIDKFWLFDSRDMYEEVKDELIKLHGLGIKLGIVANQPVTVAETLKKDGIYELFDFMGISALVGIEKPKLELYELATKKLGLAANEIVHVGNRIDNDIKPAKKVGMRTIWVMRGEANPNPTAADLTEADLSVFNLSNIAELITTL
jgi:HAD superfamily hydrolase (TIGR01549 family)